MSYTATNAIHLTDALVLHTNRGATGTLIAKQQAAAVEFGSLRK